MPNIIEIPTITEGYTQALTGLIVGDYMSIAEIKEFSSGTIYVSTNQSGNAPQLIIDFMHSFNQFYLSVRNSGNQNLPIDNVVVSGAVNGTVAKVWLHWNLVSDANFDIGVKFVLSSAEDTDITWQTPLEIVTVKPPVKVEVAVDSREQTYFPALVLPPAVDVDGYYVGDFGGLSVPISDNVVYKPFGGMTRTSCGVMTLQVQASGSLQFTCTVAWSAQGDNAQIIVTSFSGDQSIFNGIGLRQNDGTGLLDFFLRANGNDTIAGIHGHAIVTRQNPAHIPLWFPLSPTAAGLVLDEVDLVPPSNADNPWIAGSLGAGHFGTVRYRYTNNNKSIEIDASINKSGQPLTPGSLIMSVPASVSPIRTQIAFSVGTKAGQGGDCAFVTMNTAGDMYLQRYLDTGATQSQDIFVGLTYAII